MKKNNLAKGPHEVIREKLMKDPSSVTPSEKAYFDIDARQIAQTFVERYQGRGGAFMVRAATFIEQAAQELLAKEMRANSPEQPSSDASNIFGGGEHE